MSIHPKNTDYIDIHSHLGGEHPGIFRVYNLFLEDFYEEIELDVFSCGLHPWHIKNYDDLENLPEKLKKAIQHPSMIAIGEAGLDKIIPTEMEQQMSVFNDQVELSEKYGKPMIIHCVKAFQQLLKIRKDMNARQPWILHGFNSSPQLAGDLVKKSIFISASPRLMNNEARCKKILESIPPDCLFIETDDEETGIVEIYTQIAGCLGMKSEQLRDQVQKNYRKIFSS